MIFQVCILLTFRGRSNSNVKMGVQEAMLSKLKAVGLDKKERVGHGDLKRASILVPLFFRSGRATVLLTQRPRRMKSHGGEGEYKKYSATGPRLTNHAIQSAVRAASKMRRTEVTISKRHCAKLKKKSG